MPQLCLMVFLRPDQLGSPFLAAVHRRHARKVVEQSRNCLTCADAGGPGGEPGVGTLHAGGPVSLCDGSAADALGGAGGARAPRRRCPGRTPSVIPLCRRSPPRHLPHTGLGACSVPPADTSVPKPLPDADDSLSTTLCCTQTTVSMPSCTPWLGCVCLHLSRRIAA